MSVKPTNIPTCHLRKSADSAGNISRRCKLGEVTENIRTFALPFDDHSYTFKMQYQYDSYNRIQRMTYPDGEVVTYGYNRGGMLKSVVGNKNGVFSDYIKEIHYNKYELKDTVSYGNGTGVRYMYDSLLRLSHLRSACADGTMQDIVYTYDSVSNITGIVNSAAMLPNGLGGTYSGSYKYNNLYRLTNAEGSWQGLYNLSYHTGMGYCANGRVNKKNIAARRLRNGISDTVNYLYGYFYENPVQRNTLTRVVCFGSTGDYDLHYSWTPTGNMDTCDTEGAGIRRLCWDEQNRLQGVIDENYLSYYLYDAAGDRTYKLTGKVELQNISGEWRDFFKLYNTTLYASPYVVATDKGYTKHYYAESERIASRIGGGRLHDLDQPIVENTIIDEKKEHINKQATDVLGNCLDARWYDVSTDISKLYIWRDSVQPEKECYWYHPDHLGSSSWITYSDGKAVQHLHYLPWGEDFVDQRSTTWNAMYTFSAKEKDAETGYSYFGSRYYNSDLSIWLSVDPMSDKYPSLSPYVYCADNPVKLVDPDGKEINPIYDRLGYFLGTDDCGLQGDLIVMDRKNFKQNMSHDEALKNSTYFDMYHYSEAKTRCLEHFNSLKDRPDYDGFVTISEGIQWAKDHPNAKNHPNPYNTLYIDAAQLDLGFLTVENSGLKVGDDYVNINLYDFVNRKSPRSVNTAYALGNTEIKLLDDQGTISFSGDVYDWDYHKKSPMRNSLIFLERLRTGLDDNHGFKVCIYGTAKLDQTWPY